jgi:hypothetical protein
MARMGHDDMRAALIYQRAMSETDRKIAERLCGLVDEHRRRRWGCLPRSEDSPTELQEQVPERMTGIEPAYSAWEPVLDPRPAR